jgi:hypothetical protein
MIPLRDSERVRVVAIPGTLFSLVDVAAVVEARPHRCVGSRANSNVIDTPFQIDIDPPPFPNFSFDLITIITLVVDLLPFSNCDRAGGLWRSESCIFHVAGRTLMHMLH